MDNSRGESQPAYDFFSWVLFLSLTSRMRFLAKLMDRRKIYVQFRHARTDGHLMHEERSKC